ncbi:MAG: cation diffusion facilitator family transporter [Hyphomicrobiaceae bacterium]
MPSQKIDTTLIAAASIVVALAVMGIKYLAYLKTGSVALYSDALESIVNVVTAVVALITIRISSRPADRRHQFGHHKAEYFSAVIEGALIIVAALLIMREAWDAVVKPRTMSEPGLGLAISAAAMVLNATWSAFLIGFGRRHRSPALVADGWHLVTDVATTAGVLVGLALAAATGWALLDPLLAAAVAVNILWTGWRLTSESMSGLMDEAVTADVARRIREIIATNAEGALEAHDLRTRSAGRATFIEFHLVVPGAMSVADAHRICDRLEAAIGDSVEGAEVLIHVEPEGEARHRGVVVV